ncbi:hypothetical protein BABINDRAFT_39199 [Babjeviella inositovora NRRL Y-12698]|uniref:MARVEL domain-containing protein n=1 Tax=Babjeviella inositovora NRRL Y-12698 TaxID=984486 RepID=A0A1E3QLM5_9ASCO|nr:uncharacterized protein BABINDRAFT_39199 [Babjeviella inositovora NRRL Y-12698]ODQ78518.1 hypothetical protein BABINDRAFT_39199 [Babjeviella inositovora NRRL Y-12698]
MLAIGDNILRGINFVILIITLGITASLASGNFNNNPQVNFAVFAATFGILFSSIYGALANVISALAVPIVLTVIEFLNFVFTFAGGAALATAIRVHSCSNFDYVFDNKIAQGSEGRCRKAQASTAFLFISSFIFLASLGFQIYGVASRGAFGVGSKRASGGIPTAQV